MPRRQFVKASQPRLTALASEIDDPKTRSWAEEVVRALTAFDDFPTVSARVYNSGGQTVGTNAAAQFDTARYNNGGLWVSSSASRLTAVQSGIYAIVFHGTLSGAASFYLRIGGATQITPADTATTVMLATLWYMPRDDYVEVFNSGASVTLNAASASSPEFSMHWLGPQQEDN